MPPLTVNCEVNKLLLRWIREGSKRGFRGSLKLMSNGSLPLGARLLPKEVNRGKDADECVSEWVSECLLTCFRAWDDKFGDGEEEKVHPRRSEAKGRKTWPPTIAARASTNGDPVDPLDGPITTDTTTHYPTPAQERRTTVNGAISDQWSVTLRPWHSQLYLWE